MDVDELMSDFEAVQAGDEWLPLRRAWLHAPGHLLLEYADGEMVAGAQWFADEGRLAEVAASTERHAPRGRATVVHTARGRPVLLQRAGADRKLLGLADAAAAPGARIVRHRPEKRAVVRIPGEPEARYARIVRPEKLAPVLAAGRLVAALGGNEFRAPALVSADAARGRADWTELPGRPLFELYGTCGAADRWQAAGRALRALHESAADVALPLHGGAAEARLLGDWLARVERVDPGFARELASPLRDVSAALSSVTGGAPVLLHRDFYDKQVLWDGAGPPGLLDFDTLSHGEPALDLANALVHLELRELQGACTTEEHQSSSAALLDGYGPSRDTVRRLAAYADATRLRLACVYRFRPGAGEVSRALLERVTRSDVRDVSTYAGSLVTNRSGMKRTA